MDDMKYSWTVPHQIKKVVYLPPEQTKKRPRHKTFCIVTKGDHDFVWQIDPKRWSGSPLGEKYVEICRCGKRRDYFFNGASYCAKCHSMEWHRGKNIEPSCWNNCFNKTQ